MMESKLRLVASLLMLAQAELGWGFSVYRDRIPNGNQVPHPCKPNYMWRGVGHTNSLGGGPRNVFGADFRRFGSTWNQQLCQYDSDGDGLTNGQELGDPDCVWTEGDLPTRTSSITHPGVCDPWENSTCQAFNVWIDCDVVDFDCPAVQSDPEVQNITIRFPPTAVPSQETSYMCMTFDLPGDDVYDLVADQPVIDNAQVMHHMLLFSCQSARQAPFIPTPVPCSMASNKCFDIVGGWTVGSAGNCLADSVGFRFGQGRYSRVVLQTHWNNPELRSDYTDSSGLTLHYTRRLRANSATTLVVGQRVFEIPPRQPSVQITASCPSSCSRRILSGPIYVTDALNHMHYLGKSEKVEVFRDSRLVASITNEETYSYDSPVRVVHNPPVEIRPGDDVKVTCIFNSMTKNQSVFYGDATSDEMCYGFLTVYPQEALPYFSSCISFDAASVCDRYMSQGDNSDDDDDDAGADTDAPSTSADDEVVERCRWREFANTSSPKFQGLAQRLSYGCSAFGPCRPECAQVVEKMTRHPCLHGNAWEMVKGELVKSHEGLMVTAYVTSCPLVFCPLCQRCDRDFGN